MESDICNPPWLMLWFSPLQGEKNTSNRTTRFQGSHILNKMKLVFFDGDTQFAYKKSQTWTQQAIKDPRARFDPTIKKKKSHRASPNLDLPIYRSTPWLKIPSQSKSKTFSCENIRMGTYWSNHQRDVGLSKNKIPWLKPGAYQDVRRRKFPQSKMCLESIKIFLPVRF